MLRQWLARKLQDFVIRLTRPVVTAMVEQINAVTLAAQSAAQHSTDRLFDTMTRQGVKALETEQTTRVTLSDLDARISGLAARVDRMQGEILQGTGRDFASLIRMLAAAEASNSATKGLLKTITGGLSPASRAIGPEWKPRARYVIHLGADAFQDSPDHASRLAILRLGLDRLEDYDDDQPEIWIEQRRVSGGIGAHILLPRDSYIRMVKGGTRFIETVRPADTLAVLQALRDNRRDDVRVIFRYWSQPTPEPENESRALEEADDQLTRRALIDTDGWVFPSQDRFEIVKQKLALTQEELLNRHVHFHTLPDGSADNPVVLARAYRESVAAVVDAFEETLPRET